MSIKTFWNNLWYPFKVACWGFVAAVVIGLAIGCYEHVFNDQKEIEQLNHELFVTQGRLEVCQDAYRNTLDVLAEGKLIEIDTVNHKIAIPLYKADGSVNTEVTDAQNELNVYYKRVYGTVNTEEPCED